jgi:putative tryptophan/tyrosine transport system substrate-binding protein
MTRLAFALLSFALLAAPLAVEAQPAGKVPRIGVLSSVPTSAQWDGFRQGLRELGYTEGRTILVEWRWTGGEPSALPSSPPTWSASSPT